MAVDPFNDLKECGHGRSWDVECPECEHVWRADRVQSLRAEAARLGFKVVPMNAGGDIAEALEQVYKDIVGLCEATEDAPTWTKLAAKEAKDHESGFACGLIHEAKGIRRTMGEILRVRIKELRQGIEGQR